MPSSKTPPYSDPSEVLGDFIRLWKTEFESKYDKVVLAYAHELKDYRNKWAHKAPLTRAEASRCLDTAQRLLRKTGSATSDLDSLVAEFLGVEPQAAPEVHKVVTAETVAFASDSRQTNKAKVMAVLDRVAPEWLTNGEIVRLAQLARHQIAYQETQNLVREGRVEAKREDSGTWRFRSHRSGKQK